ncbi:MAG TPA: two-component regulator propeller domain-containing protein [Bacteroidota bacterium]|nr:two-component regulator propeller domain-containing protein [Bacteroidota bacterium]
MATLLGLAVAHAQQSTSTARLLLKNYTTHDGLPDARVAPIMQDSKGYLWFGTQAGLTRYDGKEFKTFGGAKEVPGIFGRSICEDHRGAIWFAFTGFARGGLLRYFNGTVTEFPQVLDKLGGEAGSVIEDSEHALWVGSSQGLIRMIAQDSARNVWRIESFEPLFATALFVDKDRRVWIATFAGDLYVYDGKTLTPKASGLSPSIRPYAIYQDSNNNLWVGGIFGAAIIRDSGIQRFDTTHGLPARGVWCFAEDNNGNFWVGTANGLYRTRRDGQSLRFHKEQSFGNDIIYDMCLDAEGNLWFASNPGVRKLLAADLVLHFPHEELLATPGFGPIAQQPDGTILFASRNLGVFALRGSHLVPGSEMQPRTSYTILSIFPEGPGRTWYGFKSYPLMLQDGRTTRTLTSDPSVAPLSVFCIRKTDSNILLLGSNQGLKTPSAADSVVSLSHPELDSLIIFDIARTTKAHEEYMLATNRGLRLVEFDRTRMTSVRTAGLDGLIIYALLRDRNNRLWCGTDGAGLVLLKQNGMTFYTRDDGLAGNRVVALAQDSLGLIWIGTSTGLSQFDGTSFRSFSHPEGFGEIGLHGVLADRDGYMWVSSFPGITKIRSQRFHKSNRPPPIYISDMRADTLHFTENGEIELDPNPAVVTFRYAGLSFTDEASVRYRYKLEGFDRDWSPPVTQREIRYTHLGSGSYTFQVIARSADGVWSDRPAMISFTILPPVWARWWFIAGAAAIIVLSAYGVYRYRLAKALELERTRSRIAMDLHDDLGASLTRISLMTEVARRMGPVNDLQQYLDRIGETSRELIDSLGDIVWSVNPAYDTLQDVIRRVVHFGEELCEARGMAFETVIAPELGKLALSIERRRELYLLLKEAVSNAVRHSGADRLLFTINTTARGITMTICDNGRGFIPGTGKGHGMQNMNERAARLGAVLHVRSEPDKGTRIELFFKTA